ncbi:MAG: hydroxyethylthiazole kinase [Desulfurella sp.]|uniref:hydroxyethylthiazole kinase n=1 Tax=Desulfurella sp. TaxID=1962857 RepID=UPI003C8FEA4A
MEDFGKILEAIKEKNPLVYNITNFVVTNVSANALLSIGASPIMSYAKEEAIDLIKISSALLINMGTPTKKIVETMLVAAKNANKKGIPVIFDPVGVGASQFRNNIANQILSEIKVDIIKANASEIANLSGIKVQTKGVESIENIDDITNITKNLAKKFKCVICTTGKSDIISDGNKLYLCENGDIALTKITGSGCMLGSIMGATASVCKDYLKATLTACLMLGISSEIAASKTKSLGSFQVELFNALSSFSSQDFNSARYK